MTKPLRRPATEVPNYAENLRAFPLERVEFRRPRPHGRDLASGLDWCRAAADRWRTLLAEARDAGRDLRPIGATWSFSEVGVTNGTLASTTWLDQIFPADPDWLELCARERDAPDKLVLAGAGATVKQLNTWLEGNGLSLCTSGASNGQTVAGAMATGTHGSVPDLCGIQHHVVGIHLLGGPDASHDWWLEHPCRPCLSGEAAERLGAKLTRDADLFDAALVHLGGLGVVNAVLLRVRPEFVMDVIQTKRVVSREDLALLARSDFAGFAQAIGKNRAPYFVQVIFNPFGPFTKPACVKLLLSGASRAPFDRRVSIWWRRWIRRWRPLTLIKRYLDRYPHDADEAVAMMMNKLFPDIPSRSGRGTRYNWTAAMPDPEADGMGQLYTAAVAVPREHLVDAVEKMAEKFREHHGAPLVFTLRFVRGGSDCNAGLLAFTRFEHSAVIDLDGIWNFRSPIAAERAFQALRDLNIPFSHHWGKLGEITRDKIEKDYGPSADRNTPLARWKEARAKLLDPDLREHFGGKALRDWGLMSPLPPAAGGAAPPLPPARSRPATAAAAPDRA